MSLNGQWSVRLDPDSQGMESQWYDQLLPEAVPIKLPGSIQKQGLGDKPSADTNWTTNIGQKLLADPRFADYIQGEEFKSPFWLTPKRHYVGKVWYQRTISVPADWGDNRVVLFLERPHWQTTVWLDGKAVGSCDSLGTAHEYDITGFARPGTVQLLTIMVDNDVIVPVGLDAHSISDQTQSNWNGIIGDICLKETGKVFLDNLQIYPDINNGMVKLDMAFGNISGDDAAINIIVSAMKTSEKLCTQVYSDIKISKDGAEFSTVYPIANAELWSEFNPELYKLSVTLSSSDADVSLYNYSFGMREIGISDKQFTINGKKTFLRGTLECCIFPDTGYPPMDVQSWKKIIETCREFGLNHIRFHSWCPPEAAFEAADEMGFYYQLDVSAWGSFGSGGPLDEWAYAETDRMLKAYGNHPSFILLTPSNEPHGNVEKRNEYLSKWIGHYREKDPRRYYTAGSGWPLIEANNYHVKSDPRMHNYVGQRPKEMPETAKDYRDFINEQSVPVISHEIGQWCAYPDFSEIEQYNGFLSASNIEVFNDLLEKAGLGELGHDFLMASGKFQSLFYKEDIETALRTPHMAGFQLLDLHDFPGQGTAPVGVLNAYWKSKGYISAEEYSHFCNSNVILARMEKLVFTSTEAFVAGIEQANYGPTDLENVKLVWTISGGENEIASGYLFSGSVPTGGLTSFGSIYHDLSGVKEAAKLTLEITDKAGNISNSWEFWVYPEVVKDDARDVLVAVEINRDIAVALDAGRSVLLVPDRSVIAGDTYGSFSPLFWNRITFPSQKEHTLGILCDPKHPALANFPTDYYTNWQWWELLQYSKPVILSEFGVKPIVRVIDDWAMCRDLGLVFEAKVSKGRVLVCAIDIMNDLENRPVARQLKYSLLKYMNSDSFEPDTPLDLKTLMGLYGEYSPDDYNGFSEYLE